MCSPVDSILLNSAITRSSVRIVESHHLHMEAHVASKGFNPQAA
jgi:hypothetical protein